MFPSQDLGCGQVVLSNITGCQFPTKHFKNAPSIFTAQFHHKYWGFTHKEQSRRTHGKAITYKILAFLNFMLPQCFGLFPWENSLGQMHTVVELLSWTDSACDQHIAVCLFFLSFFFLFFFLFAFSHHSLGWVFIYPPACEMGICTGAHQLLPSLLQFPYQQTKTNQWNKAQWESHWMCKHYFCSQTCAQDNKNNSFANGKPFAQAVPITSATLVPR